jgi:hypothetical protein
LIFFSISLGVSVMKIPVLGSEADIFVMNPCSDGKNLS